MAFVLAMGGMALAKVSGPCVNCHTMHNSQGGADMPPAGGPYGALVNNTCLGCHTTTGSDPLAGGFPYVKGTFSDSVCLAGGFFTDTDPDNAGKSHSLGSTVAPPGYSSTGPQGAWYGALSTKKLTCAGDSGCHGKHDVASELTGGVDNQMKAIAGGHHDPSPAAYRILYVNKVAVLGKGASDYEEALNAFYGSEPTGDLTRAIATKPHNYYYAKAATDNTISGLCGNCHGNFHKDIGTASPWRRHPTDVKLPGGWEVQTSALITDYDAKYNPFGFESPTTVADDASANIKYVTCVSCHRAHGSGNRDILRFGYDSTNDPVNNQQAGRAPTTVVEFGCLGCHDRQR